MAHATLFYHIYFSFGRLDLSLAPKIGEKGGSTKEMLCTYFIHGEVGRFAITFIFLLE